MGTICAAAVDSESERALDGPLLRDDQVSHTLVSHRWAPIEDLPEDWEEFCREDLHAVHEQWVSDRRLIRDEQKIRKFQEELALHWAIETGLIERLYTADRGITVQIAKAGLEALGQFHARREISRDARALITDQREALEMVMDVVGGRRDLTTSYLKELHQRLTLSQRTCEALDQFGNTVQVELLKGQWKRQPNNPKRPDGSVHEYCPPELVQEQLERLFDWHRVHEERLSDAPEVLAAWLHHRFTQIHPFQDGNGRAARALTAAVFLKADYLVLVIRDQEHRERYFDALESGDAGDLGPLVDLFADVQKSDLSDAIESLRELRGEPIVAVAKSVAQLAKESERERSKWSIEVMNALVKVAATRLTEVAGELRRAFAEEGVVIATRVLDDTRGETWWYSQIVETANRHGYFAKLDQPRRWVGLKLGLPGRAASDARLVISFHAVGRAADLRAATAFLTGKAETGTQGDGAQEDGDQSSVRWTNIVSEEPFNFGFAGSGGFVRDDRTARAKREERFREWLERVIETGVSKWGGRF